MAIKNCTLNYTLSDSEPCRAPLEDALENDGWKKTEHDQQTRWRGTFDDSKFSKKGLDGKKYWDDRKIKSLFISYFSGVKNGESVDATFVLTVGNSQDYIIDVSGIVPNLSAYGRAEG